VNSVSALQIVIALHLGKARDGTAEGVGIDAGGE
jgi:hypothetical protein